eukprot:g21.t1
MMAMMIVTFSADLAYFVCAAVLTGIANAMVSGTAQGLLYDTLERSNRIDDFKRHIAISSIMWPLGAAASSVIGGMIASRWDVKATFQLSLIPITLALIASTLLRDVSSMDVRDGKMPHQFRGIFFDDLGISMDHLGFWSAVQFGLSTFGSLVATRVSEALAKHATTLAFVSTSFAWGLHWPIVSHLVNKSVPRKARVTVISVIELAKKAGLSAVMPVFSFVADRFGTARAIMLVSAGLPIAFVPLWMYGRIDRGRQD